MPKPDMLRGVDLVHRPSSRCWGSLRPSGRLKGGVSNGRNPRFDHQTSQLTLVNSLKSIIVLKAISFKVFLNSNPP